MIFPDGAAERAAVVVEAEFTAAPLGAAGFVSGGALGEPVVIGPLVGVEVFVLEVFEGAAVELVGAGFEDVGDGSAAGAGELGVGDVGLQLHLLEGVLAGGHGHALVASGGVGAVYEDGVGEGFAAGDGDPVLGAGGVDGGAGADVGGGGDEEIDGVAAAVGVEWKLADGGLFHGHGFGGVIDFEDGGAGDGHGFCRGADGHLDVGIDDLAGDGRDAGAGVGLEAVEGDFEVVVADGEAGNVVDAVGVGTGGEDCSCVGVGDRDFGVGEDGFGGVCNGAGDGGSVGLCRGRHHASQHEQEQG